MRRPPYSHRIMRGIYLIWRKTKINIENGYVPHWWSVQDQKDAARALLWMGEVFDWFVWKKELKEKAAKARAEMMSEAEPEVVEKEG